MFSDSNMISGPQGTGVGGLTGWFSTSFPPFSSAFKRGDVSDMLVIARSERRNTFHGGDQPTDLFQHDSDSRKIGARLTVRVRRSI
jgi:hypothetical protein